MTTTRHHIIFDTTKSLSGKPYTLAPGSTDEHAANLAAGFGDNVLRVERTDVTCISTPIRAAGRAPFSDFMRAERDRRWPGRI